VGQFYEYLMELSIEKVLQQGIAAHKEGKLQDAERLYRAILQSQPLHPDANHNLGVLAVSVNKADEALPLFKAALEANPKIEQFWLSYIDALIKEKQFHNAKQVFDQAKTQGVAGDKLNVLEPQLITTAQVNEPKLAVQNKSLSFSQKRKKLSEQKKIKKKAKKQNLKANNPSQQQLNSLLEHYQNRRFSDAENLAVSITNEFPKHQFAWKILGALLGATDRKSEAVDANQIAVALSPQDAEVHSNLGYMLQELGRLDEAKASYKEAIALKPDLAEAHYNLGITLKKLGRLDESEASYRQAITLKPDYTEAHSNLGNTLKELGRLDESEASYRQAITLKSDYAEAHYNLGIILEELGRLDEALASYTQAIALKPDLTEAYVNLGIAIKNVKFNSSQPKLYPLLIQMLNSGNFTRPSDLAPSILRLLKHDPLIKDLLVKKNFTISLNEATSIIRSLDKLPLLHHLMRLCPLPELQFEKLFVGVRCLLLKNLDKIEVSPEIIYFLSTLSIHCFTNEYVYIESDAENHLISELQANISQIVSQSEQPEAIKILCLATYRPLHQYDWCQKIESLDNLEEVNKRLIEEPLLEKMIAKDIPVSGEISDDVSLKVKEQYEENPYPRWVKLGIPLKAKSITTVCDELELQLHSENIKNVTVPFILIAGCGTGQHSIGTASRFSNCHVTAVDLSLASLAYAQRKSNELKITNLDYLQTDILHLHQMDKEFDIIESAGVLHHMDEPMAGWRVLVDLLKSGGLMNIGLYSEFSRRHIVEIRKEISALNVGISEDDIRTFRQSLTESHDKNHQRLIKSSDFFSLSTLRDLIFHVQEHRFTLPQIKNCLDELGLKFCGFENKGVISNFRELHRNEADIYDLELWHQFEERNPQAFAGMYQFWCQKY
jgi:tetratricopeptide (TPR) repeat protein/ubiquinone/menaquinone biosynthesis C-methylase UbiE